MYNKYNGLGRGIVLTFGMIGTLGLGSGGIGYWGGAGYAADGKTPEQVTKAIRHPRIAVIGGGIGGTSAAYFLRDLLGPSAFIDLYEPRKIGGRVATINIDGLEYESGGSVIHPANLYMVNFRERFGLKVANKTSTRAGFYNGKEFVLTESEWSAITVLRMLWRYGLDCIYIFSHVGSMLSSFSRIYALQDQGQTFTTPTEIMYAMGGDEFVNWTHTPLSQVLEQQGFSRLFIDEMVSVATRVNYGQSVNITAFAGMVSVAGIQSGLWSVQGGNRLIPEALLNASSATWHQTEVKSVRNVTAGKGPVKFAVTATVPQSTEASTADYDIVIIATPLTPGVGSDIDFRGFAGGIAPLGGRYQRTVATFIRGWPNHETFHKQADGYLPAVLTTCNISLDVRSLARTFDVSGRNQPSTGDVYKVFSGDLLSGDQMEKLFVSHDVKESVDWLAYPYYTVDDELPPFVLSDGLFYINGIEWAASAMEMSVIGARNVALLALKHWQDTAGGLHNQEVKEEL